MTTIKKYSNINDLSDKIYQLRADGVKDTDMMVVSKDRFQATFFRYTNVGFKKANGNMWDTVAAKFLDENREERVLNQLKGVDLNQQDFKDSIDNGEILLIVRDEKNQNVDKTNEREDKKVLPYNSTVDVSNAKEDDTNQSEVTNKHGITDAKKVNQQKAHAEAKKKHDSYMDAAEIVEEDGSRRTVSLDDNTFTIIDMNKSK